MQEGGQFPSPSVFSLSCHIYANIRTGIGTDNLEQRAINLPGELPVSGRCFDVVMGSGAGPHPHQHCNGVRGRVSPFSRDGLRARSDRVDWCLQSKVRLDHLRRVEALIIAKPPSGYQYSDRQAGDVVAASRDARRRQTQEIRRHHWPKYSEREPACIGRSDVKAHFERQLRPGRRQHQRVLQP